MIWKKLLVSFAITITVSIVFALFLLNFDFNFLYSFLFSTLLQIIGFYFYGEYAKFQNNRLAIQSELKALEELTKITTDVVCPCDRRLITTLPVMFHKKNEYICNGCNKKISVLLEAKTALATEPIDTSSLDDAQFMLDLREKLKKDDL